MPELPDITVYVHALGKRIVGEPLEAIRFASPFLLRSVDPPVSEAIGRRVDSVSRLGKRIVISLENDVHLVFHLMIAGRFRWGERGSAPPGKIGLAALEFPTGTLLVTEASSKKRASLRLVRGRAGVEAEGRGGLEVLDASFTEFAEAMRRENRTLKRALTDPRILSGIGNAYSDEILHAARLSPIIRTRDVDDATLQRLFDATRAVLTQWTDWLIAEVGDGFPGAGEVTAFREGFAVHGRYGKPCPDCGTAVQRVRYADNETNYCPRCQTGGKLLADRSLSRLLKGDWPRTIEELEASK